MKVVVINRQSRWRRGVDEKGKFLEIDKKKFVQKHYK